MVVSVTHTLQFALGYSADAVGPKVGVPRLNTPQATQVLVAGLCVCVCGGGGGGGGGWRRETVSVRVEND